MKSLLKHDIKQIIMNEIVINSHKNSKHSFITNDLGKSLCLEWPACLSTFALLDKLINAYISIKRDGYISMIKLVVCKASTI